MTERGLPIVDGAPACPFVAFDDDRDERAASPDHRHRCYAEPVPAPRALAHQEAYCLSSAFPVCPTFQDWARREAARARGESPRSVDAVSALAAAPPPQRNPPRNWAAPPPWAANQGTGQEELWDEDAAADDPYVGSGGGVIGAGAGAAAGEAESGRGLSGSFADRVASRPGEGMDASRGQEAVPAAAAPPAAQPSAPMAAAPAGPPASARARDDSEDDWDDDDDEDAEAPPPPRRRRERDLAHVAPTSGAAGSERRRRDPRAPEWERARPLEAYPTLRSRRLSEFSVPPLLVGAVALALAAAVLFALPGLLGFGGPSAEGSATPSLPERTPIVTPAPTPIPEPTDQIYIVQQGDTMSRIANRFDIPLGDLIAANAENIPDPNKLQIGDQVIIPARNPDELPAASEIPAAT